MTLADAIDTIECHAPAALLSDGATTWDLPNLREWLSEGTDGDREVHLERLSSGLHAIRAVSADGMISTGEPLYLQVRGQ